jgi:hypothetical protein
MNQSIKQLLDQINAQKSDRNSTNSQGEKMNRRQVSRYRGLGMALLAYALASLCALAFQKQDEAEFTAFTYCLNGNNELTAAKVRSRFWGTKVASTSTQVLSKVFRLNATLEGDKKDGIAESVGSAYAELRQLNILPA